MGAYGMANVARVGKGFAGRGGVGCWLAAWSTVVYDDADVVGRRILCVILGTEL